MAQLDTVMERELQKTVDAVLADKEEIRVLEAGCGSVSQVKFNKDIHLIGIDISEKQLDRNKHLNEKIVGDIQYHVFPPMTFDVIVCWDVFEHLAEPQKALDRFADCLKPDGIIILKLPNLASVKGLMTKYTPHWFHVWWYRYVYGRKQAGRDDVGPFKAYMRSCISPNSLRRFAAHKGLEIILLRIFETSFLESRNLPVYRVYRTVSSIFGVLSLGRLGESEVLLVLKR